MSRLPFFRGPAPHLGVTFVICVALLGVEDWIHRTFPVSYLTDFGRHALLALGATFLSYRAFLPLLRRYRETRDELAEALRKNQLILQYAGEGIYGLDAEGRLTFVNCAAQRMLGYGPGDLGTPLVHNIAPRCGPDCQKPCGGSPILETCRDGRTVECDDAIFVHKDGQALDVQYTSAPILEDERIAGAVVIFSDNTERKRSQADLARWQTIFDHAEWGVIVYDVKGNRIDRVNRAFARMHGYTVDEIARLPVKELFAEEYRGDLEYHVDLIHERGHHVWESCHVRKDGTRFPVQIDATAVKDETGAVLYRVVNVQDITERRKAEDVLRESEAMLACAQAQGKLGSWQMDIINDKVETSAEFCRIFGIPLGTRLDYRTFLACVHPEDRAYVDRAWRAAMAGDPYDIQHRIVVNGEIKWVRERAELEFATDWTAVRGVGTTQDITELKRHEDELLRSRQSLRDLAAHHENLREEERAHLAREIHDEFGQFLTALRMDTAILKRRFASDNAELEQHANNMIQTIDKTIGVVRYLASALRPAALDMGLASAAEWLLSEFEARSQVRCRLHAPIEQVELDEERCMAAFRVLQESLTNIARYARATEVNVRIELVDDVLEMEIRDDGVGFDKADVQGRKTFGLMGMRERVLRFGGESRIETQPGAGTTVHIRIPFAQGAIQ